MITLNSLRARMTVTVTLAFAVWMLLVCVGVSMYTRHIARHIAEHALDAATSDFSHDLNVDGGNQAEAFDRLGDTALNLSHNLALQVVDARGQVLWRSQSLPPHWPNNGKDVWLSHIMPAGNGRVLMVGYDWNRVEERLHEQALLLLLVSLLVVLAAAFCSWESLRVHLSPPSTDVELVELVGTFNNLLARLRETAEAKGRFYAAASHELRTPLQALSGHLEVALSRPRSAEEYHGTLQEAYDQTRRLISLARDLLFLNQLETTVKPPASEQVSIAEICERELRLLQPLIANRELCVTAELEADGEIMAPPTHVAMLIRNTLENAVKYATDAGEVRLALHEEPHGVRVEVFNSFPPTPGWNSELLFEPFYRPDASRNTKTGGNGLGLAISKAITVANAWSITLEHTGDGVQTSLVLVSKTHT